VSLQDASAADLAQLTARLDIEAVIRTYCRACDRGDAALMASCYHPDGREEHGIFSGGAAEYAAYMIAELNARCSMTQHHVTNILIDFEGEAAFAESYVLAFHRYRDPPDTISTVAARYVDRFERRDGAWKIAHRQLVVDWTRLEEGVRPVANAARFQPGARDRSDLSYMRVSL
jgi:ketosteroid isomerase-like protein